MGSSLPTVWAVTMNTYAYPHTVVPIPHKRTIIIESKIMWLDRRVLPHTQRSVESRFPLTRVFDTMDEGRLCVQDNYVELTLTLSRSDWRNQPLVNIGSFVWYTAVCRSPRWTSGSPRMLLVLVCEFESRRGEILNLFAKKKEKSSNC